MIIKPLVRALRTVGVENCKLQTPLLRVNSRESEVSLERCAQSQRKAGQGRASRAGQGGGRRGQDWALGQLEAAGERRSGSREVRPGRGVPGP